jgi:hypothetical protein
MFVQTLLEAGAHQRPGKSAIGSVLYMTVIEATGFRIFARPASGSLSQSCSGESL